MEPQSLFQNNNQLMTTFPKICRFCLFNDAECKERPLVHLFQKVNYEILAEKVQNCLNLKLTPSDKIPPIVCQTCVEKVNYFSDFIELCTKSEKQLQRLYGLESRYSNTSQTSEYVAPSLNWISDEQLRIAEKTESDYSLCYKQLRRQESNQSNLSLRRCTIPVKRGKSNVMLMAHSRKPKEKQIELRGTKSSHTQNLKCKFCKKKFSSFYEYQHHVKMMHDGEKLYKCGKCDKIFMDQQQCVNHENKHKIPCQICQTQILAKNMGMHLHRHAEKFRTTPGTVFQKQAIGKNQDQKIACKFCQKIFKSEKQLLSHTKKAHDFGKGRKTVHKKQISGNKLKFKIRLNPFGKGQKYKCKLCGQQFAAIKQLRDHMANHKDNSDKKNKCPKCNKQFMYKSHFNKHIVQCFYAPSQVAIKRTSSLPTTASVAHV